MTLLSVIIPAWNRADVVERCVRSVLQQTLADLEVIVVDNGSVDGTAAAAAAIADPRVRVIHLDANVGAAGGRNVGLEQAVGTYVGFIDSDDEAGPNWSALVSEAVNRGLFVVTGGFSMLDAEGAWRYDHLSEPMGPAFFGLVGPFQAGTFVARADVLRAIGGYKSGLRYSENTELALRLSAYCGQHQMPIGSINEPLLRWHHNESHVYDPRTRMDAVRFVLEQHRDQLARDRPMLLSYMSQLGVWHARLGDLPAARQQFLGAWKLSPMSLRNLGRGLVTFLGPLARRAWPA